MNSECWPLGSEFGITEIQQPSIFPEGTIGYKVVLDPGQTIATLPAGFNREAAVIAWLRDYLECFMGAGSGGSARYQQQYAFYQQVYLGTQSQSSLIGEVIGEFTTNCPATLDPNNLDSYLNCDPANGAIGRISAAPYQGGEPIQSPVAACQGTTPADVLSSSIDFLTPFQQEMSAVGPPVYGYHPSQPTILLPVLVFGRDLQPSSPYSVLSCDWQVISYSRAASPYNYPR
jgi:hypothetical protein